MREGVLADVVFFLHRVYPDSRSPRDDIDLRGFERALSLIESRFQIVPLEALFEEKSSKRRAAITFDDGYADNWVYAYPVLKRRGLKAHLFVSAGRILPQGVRPTLSDYWDGKVSIEKLYRPRSMGEAHLEFVRKGSSPEFLSWEELDLMSDVFSFGSHGENHYSYPCSDRVIDFYDGKNLHWTMLLYGGKEPPTGLPVFPTRSSLSDRRFHPFKEVIDFCASFPKEGKWKEELRRQLHLNFKSLGRFESKEEAVERVRRELLSSKKRLEERLGIKVSTFAWPFGQYSDWSREIASSIYPRVFTIKKGFLTETSDPAELPRVSLGKDFFTVLGRVLTFSTAIGFRLYRTFKGEKLL